MQIKHFFQLTILLLFVLLNIAHAVNYGEAYYVGQTWWHAQHNSTVGKMVVRDDLGGTHFVWTNALDRGFNER